MRKKKTTAAATKTALVLAAAGPGPDGVRRIACARAFRLSKAYGIPLAEIGRICNQNGVKIARCQLGLFR